MGHLTDILIATQERIAALRSDAARLEAAAAAAPRPPAWRAAFDPETVGLIAEVKRRSPSAGAIAPGLDPAGLARAYVAGGAAAVSVLTDDVHFGGSMADLAAVRAATAVPVLRKDFILDPVQLFEARAAGASAVLLIVRALTGPALRALSGLARDLGLARLVEVHSEAELETAIAVEPDAIGVNSRDLDTFSVDSRAVAPLLSAVPPAVLAVAESGIRTREDVVRAAGWGAGAVLVGTALAAAAQPDRAAAALVGVARRSASRVAPA